MYVYILTNDLLHKHPPRYAGQSAGQSAGQTAGPTTVRQVVWVLSGGLSAHFAEIYAANPPLPREYFPPSDSRVVSEWFPSGCRVVSEWFPSGFRVVLACSKPVRRLVPAFWALKAVRRVVRGFVPAFGPSKLSGGLSGGLSQDMKTGVYAEPPLSMYIYIYMCVCVRFSVDSFSCSLICKLCLLIYGTCKTRKNAAPFAPSRNWSKPQASLHAPGL